MRWDRTDLVFFVIILGGIAFIAIGIPYLTRADNARRDQCVNHCFPYSYSLIEEECYCADEEGRFVRAFLEDK